MTRLLSLLTAAVTLAACSNPTSPPGPDQTAKAKAALAAASNHGNAERSGRLASN